jgi:alanyl-tRNA synthetase
VTDRLYYHDAALLDFDATAIEHVTDALHVVLDRTAFYPTSGGQPHDTGHLGGSRVVDVIDEGQRIVHVVDAPVALGPVHGRVDGPRRRDHRQQHTAQHVLSALAGDRFGWDTVSVHFGPTQSTIEFDVAAAPGANISALQEAANDVVGQAHPVVVGFEDAAAAERAGLRKPAARTGVIRVISIADIDRSACGGTHVTHTSEIGPVLLLGVEKIRGHVRVGFLAGDRVLVHARESDAALDALAREMGCAAGELTTLVPAKHQEIKTLREQLATLEQEVAASRVRGLYDATGPGGDGVRRIVCRPGAESPSVLRQMAQAVAPLERAIFAAVTQTPPTIYFATSADSGLDAGAMLKAALGAVGGRGGGSERVAQGTAPSADALETAAAAIVQGAGR